MDLGTDNVSRFLVALARESLQRQRFFAAGTEDHQLSVKGLYENSLDTTGLSGGVSCLLLLKDQTTLPWMPRACPVEVHVCCYSKIRRRFPGCHGLAPWRLTLVATPESDDVCLDATRLPLEGHTGRKLA